MKQGNWVPMDKSLIKTLGNLNRPYSIVEAMFCHQYNVDCGKAWTLRGYAKLWQWSVGKVKRLIEGLRNTSGTVVERKGNGSGTAIRFVDGSLKGLAEHLRNSSGTVVEHKRVANINPNPKPKPKEEKETPFRAIDFLLSLGVEKQIASDWLKVRKGKKSANTETAFVAIQREIEKSGEPANDIITECCERGWAGFKNSWDRNGGTETESDRLYEKEIALYGGYT